MLSLLKVDATQPVPEETPLKSETETHENWTKPSEVKELSEMRRN